jgi:pheromone shutdown protein TraB
MITLVGVGHVFELSEKVKEAVRSRRPAVVCLELDPARYHALMNPGEQRKAPLPYMLLARFQQKMASDFGTEAGDEMMAAASAAGEVGAKVALIDVNASGMFGTLWHRMPLRERFKLIFASMVGLVSSKETVETEMDSYEANDVQYLERVGEEFPTVKEVLIDGRNRHMASRIKALAAAHGDVLAVVGDGHVPGMLQELSPLEVEVIRLKDIRSGALPKPSGRSEYTTSFYIEGYQ